MPCLKRSRACEALDHTEAIDNSHRYLITAFLTVCERRTSKVQSSFGRQGFVAYECILRACLNRTHESINCQRAHQISNVHG